MWLNSLDTHPSILNVHQSWQRTFLPWRVLHNPHAIVLWFIWPIPRMQWGNSWNIYMLLAHLGGIDERFDLSVSPAPLSYCCSLGQTIRLAYSLSITTAVWKPCPTMFLHNFGHGRPPNVNYIFHGGIYKIYIKKKYGGNSKRGFTDHNATGRSLILRSDITIILMHI